MSSMFKKKGGLAFKPRIPPARSRPPAGSAAASQSAKVADSQTTPEVPSEDSPRDTPDVITRAGTVPGSSGTSDPTPPAPAPPPEPRASPAPTPAPTAVSGPPDPDSQVAPPKETPYQAPRINDAARHDGATEASTTTSTSLETRPPTIRTSVPSATEGLDKTGERRSTKTPTAEEVQDATPQSEEAPMTTPETSVPNAKVKRRANSRAKKSDNSGGSTTRTRKRQPKAPQEGEEEAQPVPRKRRRQAANNGENASRRTRSVTPEGAEEQVVDLQKLTMAELTRDLRIGKKFSRHEELLERERQRRIKAKLKKDGELVDEEEEGADNQTSTQTNATGREASKTPSSSAPASGPQFRIVDGQIVVDQSSLVMDRHARAAAAQEDMETIEENDFTRLITSSSFMNTSKLKGPNIWSPEETELFYRGLRMFGTDFEMISKMFSNKQRRHIKLKFNREERHCPKLIDAALIGEKTTKMDIDEYKAVTGSEFESVETIEAEQRKVQEEFEAERQRIADEQAEAMRKKREELFADDDGNEGEGKKKKTKKKHKQAVQYGLNGEPITES